MTLNDPELMVREWLEKIYALAGPGADLAADALELLDTRIQPDDEEDMLVHLMEQGIIPQTSDTFQAIGKDLARLESLDAWAEQEDRMKEIAGDDLVERLEIFAAEAADYEQQAFDLHDLCVEAGLLAKNDYETDPLPLLRMFLPI